MRKHKALPYFKCRNHQGRIYKAVLKKSFIIFLKRQYLPSDVDIN